MVVTAVVWGIFSCSLLIFLSYLFLSLLSFPFFVFRSLRPFSLFPFSLPTADLSASLSAFLSEYDHSPPCLLGSHIALLTGHQGKALMSVSPLGCVSAAVLCMVQERKHLPWVRGGVIKKPWSQCLSVVTVCGYSMCFKERSNTREWLRLLLKNEDYGVRASFWRCLKVWGLWSRLLCYRTREAWTCEAQGPPTSAP